MKNFFKRIRSFLVLCAPFCIGVLFIVNLVVSFFSYRSSRPQFLYRVFVVTNVVSTVTTSFVGSVSQSFSNGLSIVNSPSPVRHSPPVISLPYDYFVLSGKPYIRYFDKHYTEGDYCSRGMIMRIFPDRVFLWDGSVIENARLRSSDNLPLERNKKNDRKSIL